MPLIEIPAFAVEKALSNAKVQIGNLDRVPDRELSYKLLSSAALTFFALAWLFGADKETLEAILKATQQAITRETRGKDGKVILGSD